MTRCADDSVEFFPRFEWAVPKPFARALSLCRFTEGDVFYDTRRAYVGAWGDAVQHVGHSVQVKEGVPEPVVAPPPDQQSLFSAEDDQRSVELPDMAADVRGDSVFKKNWERGVQLDLLDVAKRETRSVSSTHGRLYTLLWKGDPEVLSGRSPAPPVPWLPMRMIRLKNLLAVTSEIRDQIPARFTKPVLFLMPFDKTRGLLVEKAAKVEAMLAKAFELVEQWSVLPAQAAIPDAVRFVPTAMVLCFAVDCPDPDRVSEVLKSALYVPVRDKKTERETFRLSAHGHLQAL
jgi:hypothetical protein